MSNHNLRPRMPNKETAVCNSKRSNVFSSKIARARKCLVRYSAPTPPRRAPSSVIRQKEKAKGKKKYKEPTHISSIYWVPPQRYTDKDGDVDFRTEINSIKSLVINSRSSIARS
eukprot:32347_1